MKKIIINSQQTEETRIAIIENNKLLDLDIENINKEQKKSNIYKAKISRIEPSLNATFVNYGEEKNGFLPFKEIAPEYFKKSIKDSHLPLHELLQVGQEMIVQIVKEERANKGAALTTFITLAGCYMVLMPNNPNSGGISRRIEGSERQQVKTILDSIIIPKNMGIIIRTAGVDRSLEEIQSDLNILINLWKTIQDLFIRHKTPFLIHKESDITIRAIRDYLKSDINEIIVDNEETFQYLKKQLSIFRPEFVSCLQLYKKELPIFHAFNIEKQIENAFKREVILPSGGSIIIDITEALTAIDINSARATKGDNIEETAHLTNIEACEEIARQLRLRDLGGLIIIDFIDMSLFSNQKLVEKKLIESLYHDRAKIQMSHISKFGLVELSRQRLQASLGESVMNTCPRCKGQGFIHSISSIAMTILRNIYTEAIREKTNELRVQLPLDVATFILNEKRYKLSEIEMNNNVKVLLIPNVNLQSPNFSIQRIWGKNTTNRFSFNLMEEKDNVPIYKNKIVNSALKFTNVSSNTVNNNISKSSKNFLCKFICKFFKNKKLPKISKEKSSDANADNKLKKYIKNENNNKKIKFNKNNQRLKIHSNDEIIDISVLKKEKPTNIVINKENSMRRVLLTNTEEKISSMVVNILKDSNKLNINENNFSKIETKDTLCKKRTKYINLEVINLNKHNNLLLLNNESSKSK